MGASGNVVPCIIRLSSFGSDNKPVVFEEKLTLESLRDWAAGVKSGKYKYVPKSEPVPAENSGPVKGKDRASCFSWLSSTHHRPSAPASEESNQECRLTAAHSHT